MIGKITGNAVRNHWWVGFPKNTGLENIKTAMANSYEVYPLITPSFTKVTSQTLIDELENLKNNAKSYKDVTYITQTNDDLPFIINASALMKGDE